MMLSFAGSDPSKTMAEYHSLGSEGVRGLRRETINFLKVQECRAFLYFREQVSYISTPGMLKNGTDMHVPAKPKHSW